MRLWINALIFFLSVFILMPNIAQAEAPTTVTPVVHLGHPDIEYGWAQGFDKVGSTYYVYDGTKIFAYEKGNRQVYFDMKELKPYLPEYLAKDDVLYTFRLSQMDMYKDGKLYVAGLVFVQTDDNENYYGYTYNLIFSIDQNKSVEIINTKLARKNSRPKGFVWYETASGGPEDIIVWKDGVKLYNYAKYVVKPHFSFTNDGTMIYLFQEYDTPPANYVGYVYSNTVQVIARKNGEETLLYSWHDSALKVAIRAKYEYGNIYDYQMPTLEGNILHIWSGTVFHHTVDITSKTMLTNELSDDFLLERPRVRLGKILFLNESGIFTVTPTEDGKYDYFHLVWAYDTGEKVRYVIDHDYDGKYCYVLDPTQRIIFQITTNMPNNQS